MKNISILYLLIALISFTFSGCVSDAEEDFMVIAQKIKDEGPSGGGSCPVGRWGTPTCNGSGNLIYFFKSDGTGYSENPDCNGICSPLRFHFEYKVSGNTISYTYTETDDVICSGTNKGRPNVPTGSYSIEFTCQNGGTELVTEVTTNGVRRTTVFTRM
ncbi:hypothetical protein [uncultured Pontibacter sp.]|uniref:hypothetical protein n=1 Tax=uncultured Pontibacter sp. TaxID=453356 RepID=UPI00260B41E9|nr:hypothetical protein [uncultured Pontibacter sp.]